MALTDSDKRLKRTPDNDREKMKVKAERVLESTELMEAKAHPLDSTAQSIFGVPYDQLGPLQIIVVNEAAGKEG